MARAAFYCATDSEHVLGVVALLNSLRMHGHGDEFVVLDAGLDEADRALLAPHASVDPPRSELPAMFRKYDVQARAADVHILLDADMVVTKRLDPLIDRAASGSVVAFRDDLPDRYRPDWGPRLRLPGLERRPYVNTGFLALPTSALPLLNEVVTRAHLVDRSETLWGGGPADSPFLFWDQDVFNAVLAAMPEISLEVLEHRLAPHPPFRGLALHEERAVCRYPDGVEPYLLHHVLEKPWLQKTRTNAYSRLLRRLLLADDVDLQLRPEQVPLRLRNGTASAAARMYASASIYIRSRRRLFAFRSRLRDRRRARARSTAGAARQIS